MSNGNDGTYKPAPTISSGKQPANPVQKPTGIGKGGTTVRKR